ncbi:MAG: hypothetical protein FWE71_10565 [Nocardioidaceae bacterium]|nr:hypothetical protein [Nocardioidaceae bacterium]MCL2612857.1 hypothetical protein [Nocardioidaceae bacterium]
MNRPSVRRLRSALVALSLTAATAGTAVAVAGPATAANVSCTTSTTLTVNSKATTPQIVSFGTYLDVQASVSASCTGGSPNYVEAGTLWLQKRTSSTGAWTTIAKETGFNAESASKYGTNVATRTTQFRAVYYGGAYNNGAGSDTFANSSSKYILVGMIRASKDLAWHSVRGGIHGSFKFSPAASIKGLKAEVEHKSGTHWKILRKVKANSKGIVTTTLPLGKNRIVVPTARGFVGSYHTVSVTRARATHRAVVR